MEHLDAKRDWQELLEHDSEWDRLDANLPALADEDEHRLARRVIGATVGVLYSLLADDETAGHEDTLSHLDAALRRAEPLTPLNFSTHAAGLTSSAVLLASLGFDADPTGVLERRIAGVLEFDNDIRETEKTSLALACLSTGLDGAVEELIGRQAAPYEPGREYGPDTDSFIRGVLAAVASGAGADEFAPTWRSFCDFYPAMQQTGSLTLPDLVLGAYAVYTRIYGVAPGDVFEELHGYVHAIADG